jgi:hypothetical protein
MKALGERFFFFSNLLLHCAYFGMVYKSNVIQLASGTSYMEPVLIYGRALYLLSFGVVFKPHF